MSLTESVKALWFVVIVAVSVVLAFAGVFALVVQPEPASGALLWLGVGPLTVFIFGPVFLGSLVVFWDARQSVESRRYFAVTLWIVLGLEALAAVAIVVYAALAETALWLPVVFIAAGAAITGLVLALGPRAGERSAARAPAPTGWTPVPRREIVQKVRVAALTLVGTFVVFCVALLFVLPDEVATAVRFAAQLAFTVTAIVLIAYSLSLTRRVRDITGRDLGRTAKIARVVLRGKPAELSDDERVVAAKYAAAASVMLAFQIGYVCLIWAGIAVQQVGFLDTGLSPTLAVSVLVAFVAVIVVLMPLMVARVLRARRYAREHADLLPSSG